MQKCLNNYKFPIVLRSVMACCCCRRQAFVCAVKVRRCWLCKRHVTGVAAQHQLCGDEEFHQLLSSSYAGDSGESQQVARRFRRSSRFTQFRPSAWSWRSDGSRRWCSIVRLINALLSEAIRVGASNTHIEAFWKRNYRCVYVDGQLHWIVQPRRELAPLLVSRIKVMAKLDIAEKRRSKMGVYFTAFKPVVRVDVRVSTLPSITWRTCEWCVWSFEHDTFGLLLKPDYERLANWCIAHTALFWSQGRQVQVKLQRFMPGTFGLQWWFEKYFDRRRPDWISTGRSGRTQVNTKVDLDFCESSKAMPSSV